MERVKRKRPGALVMVALIALAFCSWCAAPKVAPPDVAAPVTPDAFCPEYDQEGFINPNLYRVVIVEPRGAGETEIRSVTEKARLRALSSMQKYLLAHDRAVDQNVTAELLSLVERHGTLEDKGCASATRYIYYFNINKENLQDHLSAISRKR